MSSATWDAVVVGAGPAGCVAAASLARAGAAVLLVERAGLPRDKVCGCCLAAEGVGLLRSMGVLPALTRAGARGFSAVHLASGSRRATLGIAPGLALSRRRLDEALREHAVRRGVRVRDGVSAVVMPGDGGTRVMLAGRGGSEIVTAKTVVVADGLGGSSLRDRPEFAWRVSPRSRIGLGAVVDTSVLPAAPGHISMHVAEHGYVGVVRIDGDLVDVAAAIDPAVFSPAGPGAAVADVLASCGVEASWARSVRWHGTPPLTRRRECAAQDGVFVVGDAAGYVEPFTGEGMTWAVQGGAAVAACCLAHIGGDASASARWEAEYRRIIRSRQSACRVLSWLVRRPTLAGACLATVNAVPSLSGFVRWAMESGGSRQPEEVTPWTR